MPHSLHYRCETQSKCSGECHWPQSRFLFLLFFIDLRWVWARLQRLCYKLFECWKYPRNERFVEWAPSAYDKGISWLSNENRFDMFSFLHFHLCFRYPMTVHTMIQNGSLTLILQIGSKYSIPHQSSSLQHVANLLKGTTSSVTLMDKKNASVVIHWYCKFLD